MLASRRCIKNVRHFWTRTTPKSTSLRGSGLEAVQPLYARKTPWWARWTWFIVIADLITTASAVELTWHYWTEEVPDTTSSSSDAKSPEGEAVQTKGLRYELRPVWQRAVFAGGQLFLGIALASLLLGTRSRIVRKVMILPPTSPAPTASSAQQLKAFATPSAGAAKQKSHAADGRRVFIQSVSHLQPQGIVRPFRDCKLVRGKGEDEMALEVTGLKGQFVMGLEGAVVNGEAMPLWKAREAMWKGWYGEKKGRQLVLEERLET
ncbi:hypothetical protein OBBRIDRAFT_771540 [Obba rivulosa]|uniref:Uncharacterized protein n=1 Tax=Obba rivulosa TaxID=1052685 RepID=A0A8E2DPT3_9APHY|nr:hypothetical protein OBBRIDRAFT_771540 [Obba rivulosa]